MDNELNSGELLLKKKKSVVPNILSYIILFLLIATVVFYLFFGMTTVIGQSMENTVFEGQQVFLLKTGYTIERGDIVTVNVGTKSQPHELIKRVIALSGDKLVYVSDRANTYVDIYLCKNGENTFYLCDEPYIKDRMQRSAFYYTMPMKHADKSDIESIDLTKELSGEQEELRQMLLAEALTVPKNQFYFLGDNRNISNDSRNPEYGTRNYSDISGKKLYILEDGSAASKFLNFMF